MRKIIVISMMLFILGGCAWFSSANKPAHTTTHVPSHNKLAMQNRSADDKSVRVVFMPIFLGSYDDEVIESHNLQQLIVEVKRIPQLTSYESKLVDMVIESTDKKSLVRWANSSDLFTNVANLVVGESLASLPRSLLRSDYNYVILSKLESIEINQNIDKIPETNLSSFIFDAKIQLAFYLIRVPDGRLVSQFNVSGHSGRANLIMQQTDIPNYNIQSVTDDTISDTIKGIVRNLAAYDTHTINKIH